MRLRLLFAAVAVLLLAPRARGQQPPRDTTKRATALDPVRIVAQPSVHARGYAAALSTSATKTPTPLMELPQSVTVIGHDIITDIGMRDMSDAVRYVPGVVMAQGEGNRDQPTIRGNNTSSDLFIDGIRDDVQFFRDLYNIERVEALFGPSAMMFGRGSGGGVLNRVTKQPVWEPVREATLQAGAFGDRRGTIDVGQPLGDAAVRVNAMLESSDSYRDDYQLNRYGVNPTVAYSTRGERPFTATLSVEHFYDRRTADRGVPSFNGLPFDADVSTFFGDPTVSHARASVDTGDLTLARANLWGWTLRNHSRWAAYDKFYQNVYPGAAVNAAATQASLSAYNNAARRHNLFNQTDLTRVVGTGGVQHTLLVGAEFGRQATKNFKNTGYFNDSTTSFLVPLSDPNVDVPVTFRQSATDANNHNVVIANSVYAQDQLALTSHVRLIAGLRAQDFAITYHNDRGDTTFARHDRLMSPRLGVAYLPIRQLTVYTNYGISYLPSAGDQFTSLTAVTQALAPEKFTNVEAGAKWQVFEQLSAAAAAYRLDRTNTRAPDPSDPTLFVQTGRSRTTGVELSAFGNVTRRWQIAASYTNQIAKFMTQTSSAAAGATPAIVPHTVASAWNTVQLTRRVGVGLGASRQSDMYAAVDDKVTLRGYALLDGAVYVLLRDGVRAQLNVENALDHKYFSTADNDNNITPGAPRIVRAMLTMAF